MDVEASENDATAEQKAAEEKAANIARGQAQARARREACLASIAERRRKYDSAKEAVQTAVETQGRSSTGRPWDQGGSSGSDSSGRTKVGGWDDENQMEKKLSECPSNHKAATKPQSFSRGSGFESDFDLANKLNECPWRISRHKKHRVYEPA